MLPHVSRRVLQSRGKMLDADNGDAIETDSGAPSLLPFRTASGGHLTRLLAKR